MLRHRSGTQTHFLTTSMRSPFQSRRQSLWPVLGLLGVASAATLPFAPRAVAIGGGVAPVSQPTSPRETTGATPSVSLFQTSASSYTGSGGGAGSGNATSSEVTARGTASSGGSDAGSAERPAPRRRRATASTTEREEEARPESAGRRRTASRRQRETAVASSGGKAAVESKDKTVVPPVVAPADRPIFTIGSGWQSRYLYRGLDIIGFNSLFNESSSIWYTNFGVEYKGFRFKLDYVQAVDPTVPFYQGNLLLAGVSDTTPFKRRIYREVDPGLSYTLGLANLFDLTLGYTFFLFPNDDFKGTHYQGETLLRLTYKQLKYVKPSFTYFHYNSPFDNANFGDLNGNYVELRLDGSLPLVNRPNFAVAVEPYVVGSYNINFLKYNQQDVGGWNTFETGVRIPVRLGRSFTVTPYGNYGLNISDATNQVNSFGPGNGNGSSQFGERTRFWGGVSLAYAF